LFRPRAVPFLPIGALFFEDEMTGEIASNELDHFLQTLVSLGKTFCIIIPAAAAGLPELAGGEVFLEVWFLRQVTAIAAPLDGVKLRSIFLVNQELAET
jgi:hypothetical protein